MYVCLPAACVMHRVCVCGCVCAFVFQSVLLLVHTHTPVSHVRLKVPGKTVTHLMNTDKHKVSILHAFTSVQRACVLG